MPSGDLQCYQNNLRDELDGAALYTKGLAKADAQRIAAELMRDKKAALDTLAREELGIDPTGLGGNPLSAAGTSFALFSLGAIFPAAPFAWLHGVPAVASSVAASVTALCAVGVLTSLFNGRSPWFSAMRQALLGCAAAAVTYAVGAALGVSLS
jgi:vacuolar iron transporter family protein